MTRPIEILLFATVGAVCLPGCVQMNGERDNGFLAPRLVRNKSAGFSTSTDGSQGEAPTAKKVAPPVEPKNTPANLMLLPPPKNEKSFPAPPVDARTVDSKPAQVQATPISPPNKPESATPTELPPPMSTGLTPVAEVDPINPINEARVPMAEALQRFANDRDKEALVILRKYDADTQDVLIKVLPSLALLGRKKMADMGPRELGAIHDQVLGGLASVRQRLELNIDKAVFCEWVKSFGDYQPVPDGHLFLASAPNRPGERAQLYVELKNFASEKHDGFYETRIASVVEIHDGKGERIWFYRFEDREKPIRRRTPLNDCFNHYSFFVPHLPAGNYTLTILIADETIPERRREARKSVEFRVGSGVR